MGDDGIKAHHEAGHAVRCVQRGRPFTHISLTDNEDPHVFIEWQMPEDDPAAYAVLLDDKMAVLTAGLAAQSIYEGWEEPPDYNGEKDIRKWDEIAMQLTERDFEKAKELGDSYFIESRKEIGAEWSTVQAIANALLVARFFTYEQALTIITDSRSHAH